MRTIMHNGDNAGQHTVFMAIPEKRFALILSVNNIGAGTPAELETVDAALSHYPGLARLAGKIGATRAMIAPEDARKIALPAAALADYAGRFSNPGMATTLTVVDDGLVATTVQDRQPNTFHSLVGPPPGPTTPVDFLAKDAGVVGSARVPFTRDDTGRVQWVASGFRLIPR